MKELCDEVGFVYYLIIARLYDLDPKLNKNERTYAPSTCLQSHLQHIVDFNFQLITLPQGTTYRQ